MIWSKNKKTMYTPVNPNLLYKNGVYGVFVTQTCIFVMFEINESVLRASDENRIDEAGVLSLIIKVLSY